MWGFSRRRIGATVFLRIKPDGDVGMGDRKGGKGKGLVQMNRMYLLAFFRHFEVNSEQIK